MSCAALQQKPAFVFCVLLGAKSLVQPGVLDTVLDTVSPSTFYDDMIVLLALALYCDLCTL